MSNAGFPISGLLDPTDIPPALSAIVGPLEGDLAQLLANFGYAGISHSVSDDGDTVTVDLIVSSELHLDIGAPGVFSIVIGTLDGPCIASWLAAEDEYELRLCGVPLELRIDPIVLQPVDPSKPDVRIGLGGTLTVNSALGVSFDPLVVINLAPSNIASSGFIISVDQMEVDFGLGSSSWGITAQKVSLQPPAWLAGILPADVTLDNVAIDHNGITAKLEIDFSTNPAPAGATVFGLGIAPQTFLLDIKQNAFAGAELTGLVTLPFLKNPVQATLAYGRSSATTATLTIDDPGANAVAVPALPNFGLNFTGVSATVALDTANDTIAVDANITALTATFPGGLSATLDGAVLHLAHTAKSDTLTVKVGTLTLAPFGSLSNVALTIGDGATGFALSLNAHLTWQDVLTTYPSVAHAIPAGVTAPADLADVRIAFSWQHAANADTLAVHLECDLDAAAVAITDLLPAQFRPSFSDSTLSVDVHYAGAVGSSHPTVAVALATKIKLPIGDLSDAGITVTQGDPSGWTSVTIAASSAGHGQLSVSVIDPLTISIALPIVSPSTPALALAVTSAALTATTSSATLSLAGTFDLNLTEPNQDTLVQRVADLFGTPATIALQGAFKAALTLSTTAPSLIVTCTFGGTPKTVDLFALLAHMAAESPTQIAADEASIPLSTTVGFSLAGLQFTATGGQQASVAARVTFAADIFGLALQPFVELATDHVAIGLANADLPLRPPRFPVTPAQLQATVAAGWSTQFFFQTAPSYGQTAEAMLLDVLAVRNRVGVAHRNAFDSTAKVVVDALSHLSGFFAVDTDAKLRLVNLEIIAPLADLSQIRTQGSASIVGFGAKDPFRLLEQIAFVPGVSSKRIFFAVNAANNTTPPTIELPPTGGRYQGSKAQLELLSIGYGFTDNSLSLALAGTLDLADALVNDAASSATLGAGIRLPTQTQLSVQLDVIPIPPPSPIPAVPVLSFDIDMRSSTPPPASTDGTCTPAWDGLQVIAPIARADLKHIAASPYFGPFPIPNAKLSADLQVSLGSALGVTVIVDEMTWMAGFITATGPQPVPFFADPAEPFFDNLCVTAQVGGFGVHFDFQRPFPTLSPTALFELVGLISDPSMRLDPGGALANALRVTLSDATIEVPALLRRWFPEADALTHHQLNVQVNLGNVVSAFQAIATGAKAAWNTIQHDTSDIETALSALAQPSIAIGDILNLVPPDIRRIATGAQLGPFSAQLLIVLVDANDAQALFALRNTTQAAAPLQAHWGQTILPSQLTRYIAPTAPGATAYDPALRPGALLEDPALSAFSAGDLITPPTNANGVLVAASAELFSGQDAIAFIGYLFDDGSFDLNTAVNADPSLPLFSSGMNGALTVSARLNLAATKTASGYSVSASAAFSATWDPLPGIAISVGTPTPATLTILGDGRFDVQANANVTFFSGAAVLYGSLHATESFCAVEGNFALVLPPPGTGPQPREFAGPPFFDLELTAIAQLGPGNAYLLQGDGTLDILGHNFVNVHGRASRDTLEVSCELNAWTNGVFGDLLQSLNCSLQASLSALVALDAQAGDEFMLSGSGSLQIQNASFDPAISGAFSVTASQANGISVSASGALSWQGRDWLSGSITLSPKLVSISGHTIFTIVLTPSQIGPVQLADMVLQVDIAGTFDLDFTSGLAGFDFEAAATLAIALPGLDTGTGTVLPIAMAKASMADQVDLFDVTLLDIPNFAIPLPTTSPITLPFSLSVDDVGTVAFGYKNESIAGVGVNIPTISVDINNSNVDIPFSPDTTVISVPIYDINFDTSATTTITLPSAIEIGIGLNVHLQWDPQRKVLCLMINNSTYDLTGNAL